MKITTWILVILATSSPAFADGLQYTITQLPNPPGATSTTALSISSAGVVGYSVIADPNQAGGYNAVTVWQGGQASLLSTPNGYVGWGGSINAFGDVAGSISIPYSNAQQPALWHNGQLQLLDTLGLSNGVAYGVNDAGVTVGEVDGGINGPIYAVMWNNGQATILSNPGIALAINNAGQVLVNGTTNSFIWTANSSTPLTPPAGTQTFVPRYLNDQGHVAGNMTPTQATSASYGFLWQDGITTQLPNLPGDSFSFPRALNNSDQLVGNAYNPTDGIHAVLWQNDQIFNLNSLLPTNSGWTLYEAMDISDNGTVVGYGLFNGQLSAFELTPTTAIAPEPTSLALLLLGSTLLLKRRQK